VNVQSGRADEAIALLHALSGPDGIHASLSATANYRAIFARDAVMAGTAGLLLGDATITRALVRTLERLRDLQGPQGQIASNFEIRAEHAPHVSFGTLAPRIDSATWYLIGVAFAARAGALGINAFRDSIGAVIRLLDGIEYNGRHLLYIPTGGNWADEYIYDGYILYDQVLRAWALRLLGDVCNEPAWLAKATDIGDTIEARYWLDPARERGHPAASLSPVGAQDMFDLAACSLLALSGVAPRLAAAALDWIDEQFLSRAKLPPAFHPVIDEGHPQWPALRRYHLHAFRNEPHAYHNGGIWPIWLGWLALALAQTGRNSELERLVTTTTEAIGDGRPFAFEEFLHGVTGEPDGTTRMAYSATGLVFLQRAALPATRAFFRAGPTSSATALSAQLMHRLRGRLEGAATSRLIIGVAGESGSGKSVTAANLASACNAAGHRAVVINQDNYFVLPPRTNHEHRCESMANVGPHEVDLDRLAEHVAAFRVGTREVVAPRVDYPNNRFVTQQYDFAEPTVLIVEGTYVLQLDSLDVRIFLEATHDDTEARRRARNRDIDAPIIASILAIEHEIIARQASMADIVIAADFTIAR